MNLHPSIRTDLAAERHLELARAMCRRRLRVLTRHRTATLPGDAAIPRAVRGHEPAAC